MTDMNELEARAADPYYELSESETEALLFRARRQGILLSKTTAAHDEGVPGCWLGGKPTLPPSEYWPWYEYEYDERSNVPMHFVAQLNLAQVPALSTLSEMPNEGTLFFFYEPIFAGGHDFLNGGSRVIYVQESVAELPVRTMPEIPDVTAQPMAGEWYLAEHEDGGARVREYKKWNITFHIYETFDRAMLINPTFQRAALRRCINTEQILEEQTKERRPGPITIHSPGLSNHHMFAGFGGNEPDGDVVRLLTMEPDVNLKFPDTEFGITFWIEISDLIERRFDNAFCMREL